MAYLLTDKAEINSNPGEVMSFQLHNHEAKIEAQNDELRETTSGELLQVM